MPIIRATTKLLKRLRLPAKVPEPSPDAAASPLGEWYANIDFIDREPFVVLLNAATGAGMVLPGRAEPLRELHTHAAYQLRAIFRHYGIAGPIAEAELAAWASPPVWANTRDRSLLGSLRVMQDMCWHHFAYCDRSLPEAASSQWEGLFKPPGARDYQRPLNLVRERLMPLPPGTALH